ncbi:hypothetical protein Tco_1552415, partial [Tanacetum coccineum]
MIQTASHLSPDMVENIQTTSSEPGLKSSCPLATFFNRISITDKDDLERDVDDERIWEAVKQCGSKKAPGAG